MGTKTKLGIGIGVVVLIVAALIYSNTGLFKGSLLGSTSFRNAKITCHDGSESKRDDKSSCKLQSRWSDIAQTFCKNKCNDNKTKCGMNSLEVENPCR